MPRSVEFVLVAEVIAHFLPPEPDGGAGRFHRPCG